MKNRRSDLLSVIFVVSAFGLAQCCAFQSPPSINRYITGDAQLENIRRFASGRLLSQQSAPLPMLHGDSAELVLPVAALNALLLVLAAVAAAGDAAHVLSLLA